ncbi:MAG: hypothetical protein Kapaf2KO_18500 [Candidatus Kapaibacteriales bacterium]
MGHIEEPKGVDFVIESEPLSDKERKEISKFISTYKDNKIRKRITKRVKPKQSA